MGKELKLEAKNRNEEIVLNHLRETATDELAEKINNGNKTLQGCWNYITTEAKKKAISGCACIEDREVFGWAWHYFWEDAIEECKTAPATVKTATTKPRREPKKNTPTEQSTPKENTPTKQTTPKKKGNEDQISVFDLFDAE